MTDEQALACVAIYNTQALYNTALDDGDFEKMGHAFTEGAVAAVSSGASWVGRQAISQALRARRQERDARDPTGTFQRHSLTTRLVEFTGPDSATGVSYFIVMTELGVDHFGRYLDVYERIGACWLIQSRHIERDWVHPASRFEIQGK